MHTDSITFDAARALRSGSVAELAQALQDSRRDTLSQFEVLADALPGLQVPLSAELNPPLWELGHIGWFQDHWLARNPQRALGWRADPLAPRIALGRPDADALYNSRLVPHDSRWTLPLPDAAATRRELEAQLARTLDLLAGETVADPAALYFYRLAVLHEDMHHEAALYMAQALGIATDDRRWAPPQLPDPPAALPLPAGEQTLGGAEMARGFAFDNECGQQVVPVAAGEIDAQVLRWADYLPFVEAGGYGEARWWRAEGWASCRQQGGAAPRYLRRQDGAWQGWRGGQWLALDPTAPACHLSQHEALAWCRWAGRRLPTEAEWVRAAQLHGKRFRWGDVWEWTDSPFAPFPGFEPHPYRDYSAPWFDGRPVLRGASFMTQPRMRHLQYRNFFPPERNDVPAGFRSCAC